MFWSLTRTRWTTGQLGDIWKLWVLQFNAIFKVQPLNDVDKLLPPPLTLCSACVSCLLAEKLKSQRFCIFSFASLWWFTRCWPVSTAWEVFLFCALCGLTLCRFSPLIINDSESQVIVPASRCSLLGQRIDPREQNHFKYLWNILPKTKQSKKSI